MPTFSKNKKRFKMRKNEEKLDGSRSLSPTSEQYSERAHTERMAYGYGENGNLVRTDDDPKIPLQPAIPVQPAVPAKPAAPVVPLNGCGFKFQAKRLEPFDILPLSIPRIDLNRNLRSDSASPRSPWSFSGQVSPHSLNSNDRSYHSLYSSQPNLTSPTASFNIPGNICLKKITKRSRWLSVHNGRPVTPYIETVIYVPKYNYSCEAELRTTPDSYCNGFHSEYQGLSRNRNGTTDHCNSNGCAIIITNPLYADHQ